VTLRVVTYSGLVEEWPYDPARATWLAPVLARHWDAFKRVTIHDGSMVWIIKP
jgi:hypothetical protein